jgi:outer membrane protein OmpA-like peptidoglycan-associated protein
MRGRLIRAVAAGKTGAPDQAARAQADYDCWILDSNVAALEPAAQACRTALDGSLLALENAGRPAPPPPVAQIAPPVAPAAAPPPPPPPPPASGNFTVYFDFDSWTLTAEDLTVITNVINTARAGGQSHITVVGHTDTSGSAEYNQKLSVRRANVVVEALVDMGARRAAIQASGVGETDLAVQTPDNIKEARNRRSVVALAP